MADKVWFNVSVEGLFVRGIGKRMTPSLKGDLLSRGIDVDSIQPAYPAELVRDAAFHAAKTLFPTESEDEALFQLGILFMRGYFETLVGKAVLKFLKLIGPMRSLERMERNLRTGNNYVQSQFVARGPKQVELLLSDMMGLSSFYAGLLTEGGRAIEVAQLTVKHAPQSDGSCRFDIHWVG